MGEYLITVLLYKVIDFLLGLLTLLVKVVDDFIEAFVKAFHSDSLKGCVYLTLLLVLAGILTLE